MEFANKWSQSYKTLTKANFTNLLKVIFKPARAKLLVLLCIISLWIAYTIGYGSGLKKNLPTNQNYQQISVNRNFKIKDNISIDISSIEVNNQVVIEGKPVKAPSNRQFLIAHFFINNKTADVVNSQPVNLFRLVDSTGRRLAPDLYDKIVTIFTNSSKESQVGFYINKTTDSYKLEIGDDTTEKSSIEINF